MRYVYGMRYTTAICMLIAVAAAFHGQRAGAQGVPGQNCGVLDDAHYGPFDYTNPVHRREHLPIVERVHFNDNVYYLRSGATRNESPLGDIVYTLRAFPNHHRALETMARLHRQEGTDRLRLGLYSLTCWFDRARRFKPDDGMIEMIHGVHLFRIGDLKSAEPRLARAIELMPNSAESHYNLGLLYLRLGRYEAARTHAITAYEKGFPLPGLRDELARVGEWRSSE